MIPGDAQEAVLERREGVLGKRELLLHRELRQIPGADHEVGPQLVRVADDLAELLQGVLVIVTAPLPQLDRGERAERTQLAQGPLAPARELHMRIREVQDPHGFSATASRPRPPRVSSIRSTRRPAASRAFQSDCAVGRP